MVGRWGVITRWKASEASKRTNFQLCPSGLCKLLGVEKPRPSTSVATDNSYCFGRPVALPDGEGETFTGIMDGYKRDFFVLEAK